MTLSNCGNHNQGDIRKITPLHKAAEHGLEEIVQIILDGVLDKNPKDSYGRTPLHYAAANGRKKICETTQKQSEMTRK